MAAASMLALEWWKPLPGNPEYEISNVGSARFASGKKLRIGLRKGYSFIRIKTAMGWRNVRLAKMMGIAFLGIGPGTFADHKNRRRADDRLSNLRPSTHAQNCRNRSFKTNKSGHVGVCWDAGHKKWVAQITVDYRNIRLGRFASADEAACAYVEAAKKLHGEFSVVA